MSRKRLLFGNIALLGVLLVTIQFSNTIQPSRNYAGSALQTAEPTTNSTIYTPAITYYIQVQKEAAADNNTAPIVMYPMRVMVALNEQDEAIAMYQSPASATTIYGPNPDILTYQKFTGTVLSSIVSVQTAKEAGIIVPQVASGTDFLIDISTIKNTNDQFTYDPMVLIVEKTREAELALAEAKIQKSTLEKALDRYTNVVTPKIKAAQTAYNTAQVEYNKLQGLPISRFGGAQQKQISLKAAESVLKTAERTLTLLHAESNLAINSLQAKIDASNTGVTTAYNSFINLRNLLSRVLMPDGGYCEAPNEVRMGVCRAPCVGDNKIINSSGECRCDFGYEEWLDECRPSCGIGQKRDGSGNCECKEGLVDRPVGTKGAIACSCPPPNEGNPILDPLHPDEGMCGCPRGSKCFCEMNPGSNDCCTNTDSGEPDPGHHNCGNGMCCATCNRDDDVYYACLEACDAAYPSPDHEQDRYDCKHGTKGGNQREGPKGEVPCDQLDDLYGDECPAPPTNPSGGSPSGGSPSGGTSPSANPVIPILPSTNHSTSPDNPTTPTNPTTPANPSSGSSSSGCVPGSLVGCLNACEESNRACMDACPGPGANSCTRGCFTIVGACVTACYGDPPVNYCERECGAQTDPSTCRSNEQACNAGCPSPDAGDTCTNDCTSAENTCLRTKTYEECHPIAVACLAGCPASCRSGCADEREFCDSCAGSSSSRPRPSSSSSNNTSSSFSSSSSSNTSRSTSSSSSNTSNSSSSACATPNCSALTCQDLTDLGYQFAGCSNNGCSCNYTKINSSSSSSTNPSNPTLPDVPPPPANPTSPASPTNPTNPAAPANPTNPASPANTSPSSPISPAAPTNPSNPAAPANPTNPASPANTSPTSPAGAPAAPTNPTSPANTSPTSPAGAPAAPANPTNPAAPTNPTNPANSAPTSPTLPTDNQSPTGANSPSDPTNPANTSPTSPISPAAPTNPTNPAAPANPTNPASPANTSPTSPFSPAGAPAAPTNPTSPANSSPTSPISPAAPTNPTNPAAPANPTNPASPANSANPFNPSNPTSPTDPGCEDNFDCPGNGECLDGNCYPCTDSSQCNADLICKDRICQLDQLCGNGQLDVNEQCDDGNKISGDGCNLVCILETNNVCGNKLIERPFEQCDDGNTIPGDGCSQYCRLEPSLIAGLSVCGDGIVGENEECDDTNSPDLVRDLDGCSSTCLLESGECGDGVVQRALNEQCEPSLHNKDLPYSCSRTCRFVSSECGNGIVNAGEECDEGNLNSNRPNVSCRADCSLAKCGDGIKDVLQGEQCDDGNTVNGDGCSSTCIISYQSAVQFPGQVLGIDADGNPIYANGSNSLATLTRQTSPNIVGDTGPVSAIIIAIGAAAGIGYTRRRKRLQA